MSDLMVLVSRQNLQYWKRMCSDNPASVALMISHALSSENSTEFFGAALAREAALREELAEAHLSCAALASGVSLMRKRMDAAEQRNASHESMLRHFASCADARRVGTSAMDYVAALKPTESGASE